MCYVAFGSAAVLFSQLDTVTLVSLCEKIHMLHNACTWVLADVQL